MLQLRNTCRESIVKNTQKEIASSPVVCDPGALNRCLHSFKIKLLNVRTVPTDQNDEPWRLMTPAYWVAFKNTTPKVQ